MKSQRPDRDATFRSREILSLYDAARPEGAQRRTKTGWVEQENSSRRATPPGSSGLGRPSGTAAGRAGLSSTSSGGSSSSASSGGSAGVGRSSVGSSTSGSGPSVGRLALSSSSLGAPAGQGRRSRDEKSAMSGDTSWVADSEGGGALRAPTNGRPRPSASSSRSPPSPHPNPPTSRRRAAKTSPEGPLDEAGVPSGGAADWGGLLSPTGVPEGGGGLGRAGGSGRAPGSAGANSLGAALRAEPNGRSRQDYSLGGSYRRIGSVGGLSDVAGKPNTSGTHVGGGHTSSDSLRTSTRGHDRSTRTSGTPRESWPRFQRNEDENTYNNMSLQDYMALLVTTPADKDTGGGLGDTGGGGDRWAVIPNTGLSDDEDENPFPHEPEYISGSSEDDEPSPSGPLRRAAALPDAAAAGAGAGAAQVSSRHDLQLKRPDASDGDFAAYHPVAFSDRSQEARAAGAGLQGPAGFGDMSTDDDPQHHAVTTQQGLLASGNSYDLRPATAGNAFTQNDTGPSASSEPSTKETDLAGLSGELFTPSVGGTGRVGGRGAPASAAPLAPTPSGIRVSSAHARAEGAAAGREMERPPSRQKPPPEALYLFSEAGSMRAGPALYGPTSPMNPAPSSLHRPMTTTSSSRARSARAGVGPIPAAVADASATLQRPPSRQRPPPESLGLELERGLGMVSGHGFEDIFQDSDSEDDH